MSVEPQGPPKGIFCLKCCPFGGPRSAVEVFEEAGAHDMDAGHPVGPTSDSWAKIRPPGALQGPLGPPKRPFEAQTGPFGGPRSAIEVRIWAQAHDMDAGHPVGPTSDSWAKNRPTRALRGPPGPPKGPFEAQTGPFGGPRSAIEVRLGAQAHDMDAGHPVGATSDSWAKNRPPRALRGPPGPPKGLSKPKRALLGAPGVP